MKLVELALKANSTKDTKVLRLQRTLALKKDFGVLAVQKVLTNRGSKTKGVDNLLIQSDTEK